MGDEPTELDCSVVGVLSTFKWALKPDNPVSKMIEGTIRSLPPANEVAGRWCFHRCLSVHRGVTLVTCPFQGWVSLVPGPLGRGVCPGCEGWVCPEVGTPPTSDMAYYGIWSASGW